MQNFKTLPFQVNQAILDIAREDNELQKRHEKEQKAMHKKLWQTIHAEYPELDPDSNFCLKCEYIDQGIIMLDIGKTNDKIKMLAQLLKGLSRSV